MRSSEEHRYQHAIGSVIESSRRGRVLHRGQDMGEITVWAHERRGNPGKQPIFCAGRQANASNSTRIRTWFIRRRKL